MIPRHLKPAAGMLAAAAITLCSTLAEPYKQGSKVEAFTAKDQHDKEFTLKPAETKFLLVSHDMETGKKANTALTARGKEYLGSKGAVYLANIHGMPGIGRMFAFRKMRRYTHRIILGDEAGLIARFPEQAGKVTVLKLSKGSVASVAYWTPGDQNPDDLLK